MISVVRIYYPEYGTTEIVEVEAEPGETLEQAIMERGYAQYEFRILEHIR